MQIVPDAGVCVCADCAPEAKLCRIFAEKYLCRPFESDRTESGHVSVCLCLCVCVCVCAETPVKQAQRPNPFLLTITENKRAFF